MNLKYKIFQIGFNRCGTTSLYNFFKNNCINNLKCIHWDNGNLAKSIYNNINNNQECLHQTKYLQYNFISDMEAKINDQVYYFAFLYTYQLLDQQYPDSKFILNTRNKENWINSRIKHYHNKDIEIQKKTYNVKDIVSLWSDQWDYHHKNVQKYFSNKKKLIIFDIETSDAKPLVDFFPELSFKNNEFLHKDYK